MFNISFENHSHGIHIITHTYNAEQTTMLYNLGELLAMAIMTKSV